MASMGTVKTALSNVAAFFDVSMDQLAPRVPRYAHAFAEMADEDLLRGAWQLMETWRRPGFMPTIADFREACGTDVKKRARESWVVVQDRVNSKTSTELDPIAQKALANIGGIGRLGHSQMSDMWRLRTEFMDRYEMYSREMPIVPERTLPTPTVQALPSREDDLDNWRELDSVAAAAIEAEYERIDKGEPPTLHQGVNISMLAICKIYKTDFLRSAWESAMEAGII